MKGFRVKVIKPIVILVIILALTLVDFVTVGVQVVSYAVGNIEVTNVNNVLFMAAFLDSSGNEYQSLEENIMDKNIRLRLAIQVEKEGYFNGEIQINNSNFKLKTDIQNDHINSINENYIKLNQINAGEEVILDLGIEPIRDDQYQLEFLNKVSDIQISGTYIKGENSSKEVKSKKQVQLKLNSKKSDENSENSVDVVTNKVYEIDGENKRVVQLEVVTKLSESDYPIKSTKIEAEVIDNTEKVEVSKRGTYATNNNSKEIESNWDKDNNKIECIISNPEENGKVEWNKNGNDKVLITYILPADTVVSNRKISVKSRIELYDENNTSVETNSNVVIGEEKDGAIAYELKAQEELYKGNLYYGEETKVATRSIVDIRVKNIANAISIKEGNATYSGENNANLGYCLTKINKEDVRKVLGNTGRIEILSQTGVLLGVINKDNIDQTEAEKVEIGYNGGTAITINILDAENEGKIVFENEQILQEDSSLKEYLKNFSLMEIDGSLESDKNVSKQETSKSVELKEPETFATLTSNVNTLSTLQTNENVEFNVILKTDDIKYDLYKNPIIELQLPSEITNIDATFNTVFLDELQVKSANIYDTPSGNKAMRVELEGEQTSHSNNISEGIILNINASIDVDKLASTKDTEIRMLYTNENSQGNVYEQKLPIKIKSKEGLLVYNKVENFNSNGDVLETEESETLNQTISKDSKGREVKGNTVLVNNYSDSINNVTILGKNADDSTIDLNILNSIVVSKDSQISYSENGEDWTQNLEEVENVKAYKIETEQIASSESMALNYELKLPEELGYNQIGKLEQNVTYIYQGQELRKSFGLELQTENAQIDSNLAEDYSDEVTGELEVNTTTKLGTKEINSENTVHEGETLKNIITISNKTGKDINNVKVKVNQQNAVIYDLKEKEVFNYDISDQPMIEHSYEELDTGEKIFDTIETIKSGQIIQLQYEAVIKEVEHNDSKTYGEIEITSDDIDKINKNTIENTIEQAEIKLNSKFALNEEVKLYSTYLAKTITTVENINNNELENINITMQLYGLYIEDENDIDFYNEKLETLDMSKISDIKYNKTENTVTFKINKLLANEKIKIILSTFASKISLNESETTAGILTTATTKENKTYNSNVALRKILQTEKDVTVRQESNIEEGKMLENNDTFNIKIIVNNNMNEESDFAIEDYIDEVFKINNIKIKSGEETQDIEESYYMDNVFEFSGKIGPKSQIEFEINVTVDTSDMNDAEISNIVKLYFEDAKYSDIYSNELTFSIKEEEGFEYVDDEDEEENNGSEISGDDGNNGNSNNTENAKKYTISGTAWLDKNKDGKISNNEEKISGIKVKIANKNTGEFLQNLDTETDQNGKYTFSVENGEYIVVFLYDTQKYNLTEYKKPGIKETENSDAISKNVTINNTETLSGITDSIKVADANIDDISIGLVEKEIFDLKLDKYVSKISVQNAQGTSVHEYNKEQLAKVEISSKYYKGSTVVIEYEISITNEGEIDGYANDIVDFLPSELEFNSELNKDWYVANDGNLHNLSLANKKIKVGETKNLSLVLTKTLTENEAGLISNTAEIYISSNNQNIEDKDSKPGNKATPEDDISTAGVIISIGTGILKICLIGIFIILVIIGAVILIMKRKEGEMIEKTKE